MSRVIPSVLECSWEPSSTTKISQFLPCLIVYNWEHPKAIEHVHSQVWASIDKYYQVFTSNNYSQVVSSSATHNRAQRGYWALLPLLCIDHLVLVPCTKVIRVHPLSQQDLGTNNWAPTTWSYVLVIGLYNPSKKSRTSLYSRGNLCFLIKMVVKVDVLAYDGQNGPMPEACNSFTRTNTYMIIICVQPVRNK